MAILNKASCSRAKKAFAESSKELKSDLLNAIKDVTVERARKGEALDDS